MSKLKSSQLRLIILSLFIIILAVSLVFIYNDKNGNSNENNQEEAENLQVEELDDLKEQNEDNIIKAQSYKANTLRGVDESDIYQGELGAPIEIVVYEDYSNPFTAEYKDSLDKVIAEYGDEVVIAFRPYTVRSNRLSSDANQALYCANEQDEFFAFREAVLEKVKEDNLNSDSLYSLFGDIEGVSNDKFSTCMEDGNFEAKLNEIKTEANDFGVFGAPTTFVNNELVIGARPWEDVIDSNDEQVAGLKSILEKHLAK